MKVLLTLLSFILMWQFACASKAELPQNSITTEIQKEEIEAQKLIETGIKFNFTINADGITGEGGFYTAHGYKSLDGIEIGTNVGIYKKEENAVNRYEEFLKELSNILKREPLFDEKREVGERIVANTKENRYCRGRFVVGKRMGKSCKIYCSSSLRHLLAFEKWTDRN